MADVVILPLWVWSQTVVLAFASFERFIYDHTLSSLMTVQILCAVYCERQERKIPPVLLNRRGKCSKRNTGLYANITKQLKILSDPDETLLMYNNQ